MFVLSKVLKSSGQKLKENGKNLALRPTDFESILTDIGFGPVRHFGFVGEGGKSIIQVCEVLFILNSVQDSTGQ